MMARQSPEFTFTVRFDSEVFYSLLASHLTSDKKITSFGTNDFEKSAQFADWCDEFDIVDHKRGKRIGSISMKTVDSVPRDNESLDDMQPCQSDSDVNNENGFDCIKTSVLTLSCF